MNYETLINDVYRRILIDGNTRRKLTNSSEFQAKVYMKSILKIKEFMKLQGEIYETVVMKGK